MGLKINGSTSGSIEIDVPAVAGTNTAITIPATTGGEFIVSDASGNIDLGPLDISGSASADSVVIDSSGNVGIGTSSPQVPLQVGGASGTQDIVLHGGNNTNARLRFREGGTVSSGFNEYSFGMAGADNAMTWETAGSERMRISQNGYFTTFTTGGSFNIRNSLTGATDRLLQITAGATSLTSGGTTIFVVEANGDVQSATNSYGSTSDIKLKENIVDASSQWDDLKAIQVRKYNFKEETGQPTHTQLGVIAQELELVSPGLVKESPDRDEEGNDLGTTTKSVRYSVLYMKAVKALQEAMERIETLETANASQAATIAAIEARLTALEGGAA